MDEAWEEREKSGEVLLISSEGSNSNHKQNWQCGLSPSSSTGAGTLLSCWAQEDMQIPQEVQVSEAKTVEARQFGEIAEVVPRVHVGG